jgi:hypothetical protein
MKTGFFLSITLAAGLGTLCAQGVFVYSNGRALTRLYSSEGPLAGTNIFAQMFAGAVPEALSPIGPVDFHIDGIVSAGLVAVPGVPAYSYAYAQMVVWDSVLWGGVLTEVPADQLGHTDIVRVFLTTAAFPDVPALPRFTQPAIVPIPEPPVWALAVLAGLGALLMRFVRLSALQPR